MNEFIKEVYCRLMEKLDWAEGWECAVIILCISASFSIVLWGISQIINSLKLGVLWQQFGKK